MKYPYEYYEVAVVVRRIVYSDATTSTYSIPFKLEATGLTRDQLYTVGTAASSGLITTANNMEYDTK